DVAYVRGVGDNVAPMLQELGVPLTVLDPSRLAAVDLSQYTTVVIGTRAYEAHPELAAANARLLDWVRHGGTLVVQYGQYEMTAPGRLPYPISLGRPAARVTDENAPVRILVPNDPVLTWPNKLSDDDWRGWVQERSLYMPSMPIDSHYTTPISMNDPDEPPNSGAILETRLGSGTYVYTTLSLFRQLPAGNAGASRLFLNLLGVRAARRCVARIAGASLAAMLLGLAACQRGPHRTVLTVYSPHGSDLLGFYEKEFEAAHPDVDVQSVDMGSQDIIDRLRSEKANPQADIWFGAPEEIFERAGREGLLSPYRPTWAGAVPADSHDPTDLWYGTYLTPEVIGYNSQAVSDSAAPKDWDDVLDPKWKGKVLIRDPIASGSMRAIFGGIILRSIRETGSPNRGYDWLKRLDAQTKEYTLNPTILYQKLGRQEGLITLFDMPDLAMLRDRYHIPVKYTIPTSGTPLLVDAIAIVKGAKQP